MTVQIAPPPNTQGLDSTTFHAPPLDGSIPFPELYDWHYHNSPDHPVYVFPDRLRQDRIQTIYWKELVPAIHRAGKIISSMFGFVLPIPEDKAPVLAILAASDTFTYSTVNLGIIRTGAVLFTLSPRNSPEAIAHLLQKTGTSYLLVGREKALHNLASDALKIIRDENGLAPVTGDMPVFDDLFPTVTQEFDPLPRLNSVDLGRIGVIIHSSGSTAFPKPISWTYHGLILMARFPYFGTCATIWSASCGLVVTSFTPQEYPVIPSPSSVFDGIAATSSAVVFAVPTFIESWSQDSEKVTLLQELQGIYYGGGPLTKSVGDFLVSQGVQILPLFASSEASLISTLGKQVDQHWEYFSLSPHIKAHFNPDGNGAFELVIIPHADHFPAVYNTCIGDTKAYATADLLEPHPTLEGRWRVYGRVDDQIIHSNGEKTNPGPLEAIISRDPHILSCVMFGRGRFNTGLLIDPQPTYKFDPRDDGKLDEFRNLIWPTIVEMNEFAPQHSRIFREMIIVALPGKAFTYTGKGTPRRAKIIDDYDEEIRALYSSLEDIPGSAIAPPAIWTTESSLEYVRAVVHSIMTYPVEDDDDILRCGCDSLQAIWIGKTLSQHLRKSGKNSQRDIPGWFIYENSTIKALARFIFDGTFPDVPSPISPRPSKMDQMFSMVQKYVTSFPVHRASAQANQRREQVVLITGTTGSIGANVLSVLIGSPEVTRIYAFNREGNRTLLERQVDAFSGRGLDAALLDSDKVVLIGGDLSRPDFGLSESDLSQIRSTVTHILHAAWRVDFNMNLHSFESDVQSVRNLIDLALSSPLPSPPRLLFMSSISSVFRYPYPDPVPERSMQAEYAGGSGYGESKWVAEALLHVASLMTPLRPIIVRIGQVSGGLNGCWKATEWFPSIIQSAMYVKCLPSSENPISFIPLDIAAQAIADMRDSEAEFLHLANPSPVSWNVLVKPTAELLQVPLVSYQEWLSRLETLDGDYVQHNPALRLLGFFKGVEWDNPSISGGNALGFPTLSLEEAVKISPRLGYIRSLDEDVKKWLAYWKVSPSS